MVFFRNSFVAFCADVQLFNPEFACMAIIRTDLFPQTMNAENGKSGKQMN